MSEQTFKVGDTVTYKTVDMEYYSRGYGLSYETKETTILAICYKLANGDIMEQKQLTRVEKIPTQQNEPGGARSTTS